MTPHAQILIVDDNDSKRYVKSRTLTRADYAVGEASTIAQARDRLLADPPDLVLLDVKLPDGDGRDLCAWIKSTPALAQIAVLQTSAVHIDTADRIASLDAGADGYLLEPIETEELVAHVRALLRLRQAESERQAAITALRDADRRKDEFLAMLAHELRNPLAPIRNAVEILRTPDEILREKARTIIARQVGHLSRLVDDLLEVSRITQRKVVLKRHNVSLRAVVDAAVETARPYLDAARHRLTVSLPAGDTWLNVDPVRIAQALGNLLHNAAKFTPPGGHIRVEAGRAGEQLEIAVIDDGVGISAETLPLVFDLFTQDERSLERSQGGLGIGLSLVRGMVEMHGGSVRAESAGLQHGSRFTIRLPLAANAAPHQGVTTEAASSLQGRRVLVVEDNVDAAETLGMMLTTHGHDVTVVTDSDSAIPAARAARPEVVLLDIGLPGMDGYQLARRLREDPETRDAYLIAVSGYGQDRDRARSADAGFDLHLTKPVEPAHLVEAIGAAVERPQP